MSRSDELLAEIRERRSVIAEQEIATLREIAEWAGEHVVDDEADAATLIERGLDTGLPLAGPGAPLISDFAVMELSALLGRSLDSGRNYVGQVIELAHRLPRLWARLLDGEVPVWKALRIADHTRLLPDEAAGFVDRQLAPYAHGCSWAQVDRLVDEALVRFDPGAAEERRRRGRAPPRRPRDQRGWLPASPTAPPPSTLLTPSTSNKPSPAAPSSTASSAMRTPSTYAGPRRWVRSPART